MSRGVGGLRRSPLISDDRRLWRIAQAFDQSFAEPAAPAGASPAGFLAVSAGNVGFAVPVPDLAGVVAAGKIVPVPSPAPALLGIAALAMRLVPVYDPAHLLGQEPSLSPPPAAVRWLLLLRSRHPLALAISRVDGHARLEASEVRRGTAAAVRIGDGWRPVLDLARIRAGTKES